MIKYIHKFECRSEDDYKNDGSEWHIIATANTDSIVLTDEQSALDIIMTISSKTGSSGNNFRRFFNT